MDLADKATSLRALRAAGPTPAARNEVNLALGSKFEGIQAVAAEVLGAWGDPESVRTLQEWLDELLKRPDSMAARSVAVRELTPHAARLPADGVLDRYFDVGKSVLPAIRSMQHELLPLAAALPEANIRSRLLAAGADADRRVRRAALLVIVSSRFGDRAELVRRFLADTDKEIRSIARSHAAA